MGRVESKVAFVTGGARGLGLSHCLTLAREGADVAIFDLGDDHRAVDPPNYALSRAAELDQAVAAVRALGRRAIAVTGDVREQASLDAAVAATIAELGRIDILVANAGIAVNACPTWELSRADWDLQLEINLTGTWQTCKAVVPHMIERGYGRIVLISSISGYRPWKALGPYAATKAGVIILGQTLALELAEHGITVNSVCPSTVPSHASRSVATALGVDFETLSRSWLRTQAIQTLLDPSDISNAVLFLASDEARYMTGLAVPVDGGATALHAGGEAFA